jgi:hypothetical protein
MRAGPGGKAGAAIVDGHEAGKSAAAADGRKVGGSVAVAEAHEAGRRR